MSKDITDALLQAIKCPVEGGFLDAGQYGNATVEELNQARHEIERLRAALAGAVEMTERAAKEIDRLETALAVARNDALEEAAQAAVGPVFEMNTRTGEPRYHGTEDGNWSVPMPIAGFRGDDYGTGRYDAAKAVRALKSQPSAKRMTIEEWEEWLREASKDGPTPDLLDAYIVYRKHQGEP